MVTGLSPFICSEKKKQKAKNVGIGIGIAIAIGRIGLRKPIAIAIAMPIAMPMIASQREYNLFMRRRVRPAHEELLRIAANERLKLSLR